MKFMLKASACALALAAMAPATASAQAFFSDFEGSPTPASGTNFIQITSGYGWTAGTGVGATPNSGTFEVQYGGVAGAPSVSPNGGRAFVELDSTGNNAMYRTISVAGTYTLSFLYSARPNQPVGTNGIEVYLNNTLIAPPGLVADGGGASTAWRTVSTTVTVAAGSVLSFRAAGTSDSFGGYIDNISFAAVPEPASWAMMIGGFGLIGGAMRRRKTATLATA